MESALLNDNTIPKAMQTEVAQMQDTDSYHTGGCRGFQRVVWY